MVKRHNLIIFLSILVLLLILIGNFILRTESLNRKNSLDAYNKNKNINSTIHIEVDNKTLTLVDNDTKEILKKYSIATGKSNSPTPLGSYQITTKGKWGEGFGSRWLGLDVPWGKYGIHGTNKPGSIGFNASGGCIRMRNSDVEDLFEKVSVGNTVVITNGYYGPFGYGFRNLRPGATGADVIEVQKRLRFLGYYDGTIDGIYGEGMKRSFIAFLKDNSIPLTDEITGDLYKRLGIILMDWNYNFD